MAGAFTCVGWQVTLCDPIWQVMPRSAEMDSHEELYLALTFFNTHTVHTVEMTTVTQCSYVAFDHQTFIAFLDKFPVCLHLAHCTSVHKYIT